MEEAKTKPEANTTQPAATSTPATTATNSSGNDGCERRVAVIERYSVNDRLLHACAAGDMEMVKHLIENESANINYVRTDPSTGECA